MELIFKLAGGIGLFLIGMLLLTDGLKTFAGEALRQSLVRFTGTPAKAFASGALVTLMVQSSSATTVAVIGFVSAGLLTFPQAVGVVIGTSLGTTGTGWIVAVFGLKISIGYYALPLVGAGMMVRLFARGHWQGLGLALAGFGLIFFGIETLSDGMRGLSVAFSPGALPSRGLMANVLLVLIGMVMTVLMQSSSAAVATTLTGMHTGAIVFEQAAAIVIGAAIGTTVTGAMAAAGANISAKRTALAHVSFNMATGLIAIVALPLLLWLITQAQTYGLEPGAVSLAAFHTVFIGLGVALFLPIVEPFARWIERTLPEKGPRLSRHLDDSVLAVPEVALEATRRAVLETARATLRLLDRRLRTLPPNGDMPGDEEIRETLEHAQQFFGRIPATPEKKAPPEESVPSEGQSLPPSREAIMHATDHLVQLQDYLRPPQAVRGMMASERLRAMHESALALVDLAGSGLAGHAHAGWMMTVEENARRMRARYKSERPAVLRQTAGGELAPGTALHMLDAMRWLEGVGYHVGRICFYLGTDRSDPPPIPETGSQSLLRP
jgi:phosphate:Na+ symporter